jgi:peptidyl-prolyl cis-trans isomerase D
MLRQRPLALAVLTASVVVAACDSVKGAIGSHVDTVAKAGSQELTVERLAQLLGRSPIQLTGPQGREVARNLAGLWVDYQLLGAAAARGDSLSDPKVVDDAMWALVAQQRVSKLGNQLLAAQGTTPDTANAAQRYASGELLSARHILIPFGAGPPQPNQQVPQAVKDSVRRKIEAIRAQVTPANFAQLAEQQSGDPGSARQGGLLGVFPRGAMVPAFEQALARLQPGQISGVVETPFGYHLIYRPQFAEVAPQFTGALAQRTRQVAESTYLAKLEQAGNVQVKGDAPLWTKSIAANVDEHYKDNKVLATSTAGDLTAARVARWMSGVQNSPQLRAQMQQAPDSLVTMFIKSLARQELLLKQADSAKVTLTAEETANMRRAFTSAVGTIWTGLNVAPGQLADSAKTDADRQRVAASRVEDYLDRLVQQRAQFVEVPSPIEVAVRSKYEYRVNDAVLDKALERAAQVRASRDSARTAGQPATQVPMPGAPGGGPAGAPGAPNPAAPEAQTPPAVPPAAGGPGAPRP